jgi:hypothetical protein
LQRNKGGLTRGAGGLGGAGAPKHPPNGGRLGCPALPKPPILGMDALKMRFRHGETVLLRMIDVLKSPEFRQSCEGIVKVL